MKFNVLRDVGVAVCFLVLLFLIGQKVKDDTSLVFSGHYRVVDGDSLALGETRFRLLGIDAPELSQICNRAGAPWSCGAEAKQSLAGLMSSGKVECKGSRKDKYRRQLVTCYNRGVNINREMVLRGMALTFGDYEAEEKRARNAHAGLWASDFARPADWRRTHKAGTEEEPHMPSFLRDLFGGDS